VKVLVTGGSGFIGKAVVEELRADNHEVSIADISAPAEASQVSTVDILDRQSTLDAVAGCDVVVHLAGPVLEMARRDPFHSAALQLNGTLNVLEACRAERVGKVVLASSFYVYDGLPGSGIVNESSTLDPARMELFGSLKVAAEQLLLAYSRKFALDFVILRFGSVYGLGEGSNLVQTFLKAGLRGEVLEIWGKGTRMNQYTYLKDVARGCVKSLATSGEIFNLISPEETSTGELAQMLQDRYGFRSNLLVDKPEGVDFPYMSSRKATRRLGWTPTPLREGIDVLVSKLGGRLEQAAVGRSAT
jgi:UDP-glucose 4-epimerase